MDIRTILLLIIIIVSLHLLIVNLLLILKLRLKILWEEVGEEEEEGVNAGFGNRCAKRKINGSSIAKEEIRNVKNGILK